MLRLGDKDKSLMMVMIWNMIFVDEIALIVFELLCCTCY